jgi:hypothetical protein
VTDDPTAAPAMDTDAYCREVEAHLCRRNEGHLVRLVGPAFAMVIGWAARGVPLKVACRGIDRAVERRAAKGGSRRPLRVEYCEADVLDAFDEWRRAVGVGSAGGGAAGPAGGAGTAASASSRPAGSLRAHLDRVVTRLTDLMAGAATPPELEPTIVRLLAALGDERAASRTARGEARAALVGRLRALDEELLAAARASAPVGLLEAIGRDAEQELAGFRDRMPAEAHARAVAAAGTKLLRDRLRLPDVGYEP